VPELDERLLAGFDYACRPDCGLCCYAEPRVLPAEKVRLVQIAPEVEIVGRPPDEFIEARPNGGACQLLSELRCGAHAARPHPCREFPLTAHVGTRLQATVVLSCPGVDLAGLAGYARDRRPSSGSGFPSELAALRERVDRSVGRRLEETGRRRRRIVRQLTSEGRWVDDDEVRSALRKDPPLPTNDDFPVPDPPSAEEGMDRLPLFFDARAAPVSLAEGLGGWELNEIDPEGGFARSLGVLPPPERVPPLENDAEAALRGYLRYWLERDCLFGVVHLRMLEGSDGTVTEWMEDELRAVGALTLARAEVRAKLRRGATGSLTAMDVLDGIRATDQDLLDRDTWGDRF
jgi:Putative zinc- or iron-chelating domain